MVRSRFFAELPSDHRTDWGEAFAKALAVELNRLNCDISASARTTHGGMLELLITGPAGERIEICCWEDEALVRHDGKERKFELPRRRYEPGDDWIGSAVEFVGGVIRSWAAVG